MVEFHQQQSTQAAVNKQYRMNSRNERFMMRLKAIEAEYYSIDNLKSYSKYFVFCSTASF